MSYYGRQVSPGELPGIEHVAAAFVPPEPGSAVISYTDYSADKIQTGEVINLDDFLEKSIPDWVTVRWLNVSNIHPYIINQIRHHFEFHTLTAEDVLHNAQRPRAEILDDHIFVVIRLLNLIKCTEEVSAKDLVLDIDQVSLFLYDQVLITFEEKQNEAWKPIRERLETKNSRVRKSGADYLLYVLLDGVVDHCFPVLEYYGDLLEVLELNTLEEPTPDILRRIHGIKRDLSLLRRIVWPMREVVDQLYREEEGRIVLSTKPYLRDVYEHTIQIVEIIESYRESASGLTDLYMSAVSNRMNEIMEVLTIMASLFIPLTFIAGVYGMNFHFMPELGWRWGYPAIWLVFILITVAMLLFFRRKGWIGKT